ncbi:MAG: serine/threonine protein kinase, bacterial [Mycobacterium sp.]|jgi:serine/threonine-protein kinase|nr:serine/threonine protein kinase, bacterial [Mycobacterium sp.]
MPLAQGDTFAGFTILRQLGSGGMGEVYLIDHPRLPRREALKILPAALTADDEFRQRFNREANIAADLWHPHIVAVHDRGESNGQLWITMDFVEGTDAAALIRDRYPAGLPPEFATEIVTAVADALDYAHEKGLLHRDVKPANILLSESGGSSQRRRIMLSDFGIARRIDDNSGLTATNMTVGSLAYAPPEQLMAAALDGRTDQYALAATAFQLLTGKPPFDNPNAASVITSHLTASPPKMADRRPDLGLLDPVIAKAMAKKPADRYPTCRDFASALSELVGAAPQTDHPTMVAAPAIEGVAVGVPTHLSAATPSGPAQLADAKPPRGKGIWIAAAAIAAVLLGVAAVVAVPRIMHSSPEQTESGAAASSGAPQPPPSAAAGLPVVPVSAANSLLPPATKISAIIGAKVEDTDSYREPYDTADRVQPEQCAGAVFAGTALVYADRGYTALRQSLLYPPEGSPSNHLVDQSVVLMPTADGAAKALADSMRQWGDCTGKTLAIADPGYKVTLADVQQRGELIVQDRAVSDYSVPNYRCQHSLGVWSNVVAEAVVCGDTDVGDQSHTIVEAILSNARA